MVEFRLVLVPTIGCGRTRDYVYVRIYLIAAGVLVLASVSALELPGGKRGLMVGSPLLIEALVGCCAGLG